MTSYDYPRENSNYKISPRHSRFIPRSYSALENIQLTHPISLSKGKCPYQKANEQSWNSSIQKTLKA